MEELRKILGLNFCDIFVKYVLNGCECHSNCCEICDFEVKNPLVEVITNDEEYEINVSSEGLDVRISSK